jgi:hypothetical protein
MREFQAIMLDTSNAALNALNYMEEKKHKVSIHVYVK